MAKEAPLVEQTSESLLSRTMMAMYLAGSSSRQNPPAFEALHPAERARYERMAVAALTVAYMEPVLA